jgi:calcineurin-like phosphoesterase
MIGDVVGEPGLAALDRVLPGLIREQAADFVTVNGENAADGFGMTQANLERILAAGADVVTSGNHVWEKRDFWPAMDNNPRMLRPANYPAGTVGRGWVRVEKDRSLAAGGVAAGKDAAGKAAFLVVNLQGREYMTPIDCPFKTFDAIIAGAVTADPSAPALPSAASGEEGDLMPPVVLVDFHAESTREKEALGWYLDGRASLVVGTHTHVQTADERVLSGGTAYITDLGMTGVTAGVIGMDAKICLDRVRTHILYRMECAQGVSAVQGVIAEIDPQTRRAVSIRRLNLSGA